MDTGRTSSADVTINSSSNEPLRSDWLSIFRHRSTVDHNSIVVWMSERRRSDCSQHRRLDIPITSFVMAGSLGALSQPRPSDRTYRTYPECPAASYVAHPRVEGLWELGRVLNYSCRSDVIHIILSMSWSVLTVNQQPLPCGSSSTLLSMVI